MDSFISRDEIVSAQKSGRAQLLFEVLDEPYFRKGHLPGAIAMPLARVVDVARTRLADKNAPIVTYCASLTCQNSHIAATKLRELGYTNVRVYAGGKADWQEAGLPLERDEVAHAE